MCVSYALAALLVYVAGVICGLFVTDGRPVERLGLALSWPLGPIAFVVTVLVLLLASLIAYPTVTLPAVLAIALVVWISC